MDEHDSDEWSVDPERIKLMDWLLAQKGKLYVWNADGPDYFDCSGLVAGAMFVLGLGDVRKTYRSVEMFAKFEPVAFKLAKPGDLVFYGSPERVSHVDFLWGDGRVFGAGGGDETTTTPELAMRRRGACVRFKAHHLYRPGLRGFRKFPFPPSKE